VGGGRRVRSCSGDELLEEIVGIAFRADEGAVEVDRQGSVGRSGARDLQAGGQLVGSVRRPVLPGVDDRSRT
jgi:hypothetical protein